MLFDGLIAKVLTNDVLEDNDIEERLTELCSSQILMDIVPGTFFTMHVLRDFGSEHREKSLIQAFQILGEVY